MFYFIEPTKKNLKKYEKWATSEDQSTTFLGDIVGDECLQVCLKPGNTMIIPTGVRFYCLKSNYDSGFMLYLHPKIPLLLEETFCIHTIFKDNWVSMNLRIEPKCRPNLDVFTILTMAHV